MSARQPFFPTSNRPGPKKNAGSRPLTFAPDSTNPLHAGAGADGHLQGRLSLNAVAQNAEKMLAPSGLGGIRKRKSNPDSGDASSKENELVRPGTADPHSSSKVLQALSRLDKQQSIAQPTPRLPAQPASNLLSIKARPSLNNGAFKIPGAVASTDPSSVIPSAGHSDGPYSDKNAHISTSASNSATFVDLPGTNNENDPRLSPNSGLADASTIDPFLQTSNASIKFNAPLNQVGPRRVFVEVGSAHHVDPHGAPSNHEVTENGTVRWNALARKRTIEQLEEGDDERRYENAPKRQKVSTSTEENQSGNLIDMPPIQDRPSSGFSHSMDRRSVHAQVRESPVSHRGRPQSRQTSSRAEYPGYHMQSPQQPQRRDVSALDSLLGLDTDLFVRENLDLYDQLFHKWSNCTLTEWSAGANEIASQYCKILDYVKDYVTDKVKLYGNLHSDLDKHDVILNQRNNDLTSAKKRLIQESGSFLGK
ncbi:hypothetical protein CVT26_014025 [Gymnopilus dilepis]|uniref:Extracellular mutant protein 11 C-terminal domain-containing protein n=1 Tax=Gymnopilus dilepis TaxID=231916 RepID=A0A409VTX9_9AGAR|nr:hypothetical protein CVT26_014025 [Gymnopilus dilepis]